MTVDYYQWRIAVSGDHVDPATLVKTIEKYAQIKPHRNAKDKPVAAAAQGFKNKKNFQFEVIKKSTKKNYSLHTYYIVLLLIFILFFIITMH